MAQSDCLYFTSLKEIKYKPNVGVKDNFHFIVADRLQIVVGTPNANIPIDITSPSLIRAASYNSRGKSI